MTGGLGPPQPYSDSFNDPMLHHVAPAALAATGGTLPLPTTTLPSVQVQDFRCVTEESGTAGNNALVSSIKDQNEEEEFFDKKTE